MPRDCSAWLEHAPELEIAEGPRSAAECSVIGEHEQHAGLDAEGHLLIWLDSDEGSRRG